MYTFFKELICHVFKLTAGAKSERDQQLAHFNSESKKMKKFHKFYLKKRAQP